MSLCPLIQQLIQSLRCLPGVGAKSAQRMAFYLLEHDQPGGKSLAYALQAAIERVGFCESCRMLSELSPCVICNNKKRDESQLCIVGSPSDVIAIEQSAQYQGYYFVLKGYLSPLDGMGPDDIGLDLLQQRLHIGNTIKEVILAINTTVEGSATAYYIAQLLKPKGIIVSRIAHGVPVGGELEYVDGHTLVQALNERRVL